MNDRGRETILAKIRKALGDDVQPQPMPDMQSPVYFKPQPYNALGFFAENFTKTKGELYQYKSLPELDKALKKWLTERNYKEIILTEKLSLPETSTICKDRDSLLDIEVGITSCEALIARTGSMFVSSANLSGRSVSAFAPIHVVVASTSQLVDDIEDGINMLRKRYKKMPSMISLTTGPSRTADIEKTLVLGAHGPKELHLFLWNDSAD
jgi:L-lactate dehydrogenase complex protein LldG